MRTVVLIKSNNLECLSVFEFETERYDFEQYEWSWNKNNNLIGKEGGKLRFTWQPHGSQFTINESVPEDALVVKIRKPDKVDKDLLLKGVGFDESWVTIVKQNGGRIHKT